MVICNQHYYCCCAIPAAEHIQKQLERGYASKDEASQAFDPTPLGESLISSYRRMGLDNLWKPDLRGRIEQGISRIAAGQVRLPGGGGCKHRDPGLVKAVGTRLSTPGSRAALWCHGLAVPECKPCRSASASRITSSMKHDQQSCRVLLMPDL